MSLQVKYFKKVPDENDTYNGKLRAELSFEIEGELYPEEYASLMQALDDFSDVVDGYKARIEKDMKL
jgi:hypothetical protein